MCAVSLPVVSPTLLPPFDIDGESKPNDFWIFGDID